MRLAFMGTPAFSVPALEAIVHSGYEVEAVYTQPPRPANRGKKETPSPVHLAAEKLGIPVRHPTSLKSEDEWRAFADLRLDAAVVVAYGLILPKPILDAPRLGCLNIHASLLPRWRGAAPIQRAILAGDDETGISIMQMDEGLDTGAVLLEEPVPIYHRTTAQDLHDDLSALGARLIVEALDSFSIGTIHPVPQSENGVTYAEKLRKEEGRLDWGRPAAELDRQIRAFTPWPGCFFEFRGERIKVLQAIPIAPAGKSTAGTLLDKDGTVACGFGGLKLIRMQRPGRGPVSGEEFVSGMRLEPGVALL
ncbi:methionyl-tRNA formyltransferase [Rhodospirillaceae bacterium KN72]|uniref:Methionyl-tRNA formyltransferase n=1 Tax=Pacificispira spongiicola TaxID=2729598 RepID=A0A7Y0DY48_9PROT|nr:methionyl-tRNA formyltransferase [Pacificispira spongiicola]